MPTQGSLPRQLTESLSPHVTVSRAGQGLSLQWRWARPQIAWWARPGAPPSHGEAGHGPAHIGAHVSMLRSSRQGPRLPFSRRSASTTDFGCR